VIVDLLSLTLGAAVTGGGVLVGVGARAMSARRPAAPLPPAAALVCSCTHPHSVHDAAAGRCCGLMKLERWSPNGVRRGFEWRACPCRGYDGPQPIALFTDRGIVLPTQDG
jgi:hypothetical protein